MSMFMGIVGHFVSLDDDRDQNSPGLSGLHYGQDQVSIYFADDHVSSSAPEEFWIVHDSGYSSVPWSEAQMEGYMQFEFDLGEDVEYFQLLSMPAAAESVMCFLLRDDERESVIGDLNERYSELYQSLGKRKADSYVYRQLCRSLFPLIKRALVKSGVRILLVEWIKKLTA